jgi:hypothetical protein
MPKQATTFEIRYRASGYSPDDERLLRDELEHFGAVRLRAMRLPAAGGVAEIWILVSFVGGTMVQGLIEHLTGQMFDGLSARLLNFFRTRQARDGIEPEMSLTISYDDVDLQIGPVNESDLARLPSLGKEVHDRLFRPPLKGSEVSKLVIGMVRYGDRWSEPHLQLDLGVKRLQT